MSAWKPSAPAAASNPIRKLAPVQHDAAVGRNPTGLGIVILRQNPSAAPRALQYVCQHRPQSKNSIADTSRCTQNTQMVTGPRLCQLPNVGSTRRTIKRVTHGMSATPDHLRALRASPSCICAESFLVQQCHRSRDAGRGHQRLQPVAASSVAELIFEGDDSVEGSRESSCCRCLAEDLWQTARIFAVGSAEASMTTHHWNADDGWVHRHDPLVFREIHAKA